jgi:hypothetical protein
MKRNHPRTIFVDLDGCIIKSCNPFTWYEPFVLLDGVLGALRDWWSAGIRIIIVTGRPGCVLCWTASELHRLRVPYHQLVMDVGSGTRYLVNDLKPYAPDEPTAVSINLVRDQGLAGIELEN